MVKAKYDSGDPEGDRDDAAPRIIGAGAAASAGLLAVRFICRRRRWKQRRAADYAVDALDLSNAEQVHVPLSHPIHGAIHRLCLLEGEREHFAHTATHKRTARAFVHAKNFIHMNMARK